MKNLIIVLIAAFIASSCVSRIQGNGNVKREMREVGDFRELSISNAFEVFIKEGDTPSLVVEADENLLEHIISESNRNELEIYTNGNFINYKELRLYITTRNLEDIEISGACSLKGEGILRSANLDIDVSGASEIDLEVEAGELELDIKGASDVVLKGRVESLKLDASGASEIDAFGLRAIRGKVSVSGASQADVYVTDDLKIEASGASEIRYMDTPKKLNQKAGGASEIKSYTNQ